MSAGAGVAVAFCTRNRPGELVRACATVAADAAATAGGPVVVYIVDGGPLSAEQREAVAAALPGMAVRFIDATDQAPSLYRSRILGLEAARADGLAYVTFLDDDVEVERGYFAALLDAQRAAPYGGVGGVDTLRSEPSASARLWQRLGALASADPGRLSRSGFPESQALWLRQRERFESEYLSGCNMTVSTALLDHVHPEALALFRTYSLGEDLALSAAARKAGPLAIEPRMRVVHHQAQSAREGRHELGRQLVANQIWLMRSGAGARSGVALAWSLGWIFGRSLLGDIGRGTLRGKAAGMLKGLGEAARVTSERRETRPGRGSG